MKSSEQPPSKGADDALSPKPRAHRILRVAITCSVVLVASMLGYLAWDRYMNSAWTRDGTVRAYVIDVTPEVSGRIVNLPIIANQFVRRGDVLMDIDPTDYKNAVDAAEAVLEQAKANKENRRTEADRRLKLNSLAVTVEEQQTYVAQAQIAEAAYNQDAANLAQARVNLQRTHIVSPVNGYVTNLFVQKGDYATAKQRSLSVVDADSFWVDGYFQETQLRNIRVGNDALVTLMGHDESLKGRVSSISRGISVPNAQADPYGLASVNPIFTWVRLAQRVPVRIQLLDVPEDLTLAVGLTATVEILPRARENKPSDK